MPMPMPGDGRAALPARLTTYYLLLTTYYLLLTTYYSLQVTVEPLYPPELASLSVRHSHTLTLTTNLWP